MFWLAIPVIAYLALGVLVWWLQDAMLFPGAARGEMGVALPEVPGVAMRRVEFAPGKECTVAVRAAEDPVAVCLLFLGNGEDMRSGLGWLGEITREPYRLTTVVVEYPGYGSSDGEPSGPTMYGAADAVVPIARELARELELPLLAFGSSLGSFCAVHLARQGVVDGVVLRCPPASVAASARDRFPWLPTGLLLRHHMDNVRGAAAIRLPLLLVHGTADSTTPVRFGRQVAEAWGGDVEFLAVPGAGHNDVEVPAGKIHELVESIARSRSAPR